MPFRNTLTTVYLLTYGTVIQASDVTFSGGSGLGAGAGVALPRRIAVAREVAQFEVADGQPDDGSLVQLAGDGGRQRQQLGQLVELVVLLAAPRPRRVARLLLAKLQNTATTTGQSHVADFAPGASA